MLWCAAEVCLKDLHRLGRMLHGGLTQMRQKTRVGYEFRAKICLLSELINLGQSLDAKQAYGPFLEDFCEVETLRLEVQLLEIQVLFRETTTTYT